MLRKLVRIAGQQKIVPRIGEFKETLSQVLFWGGIVNYLMVAGTFYYTTLRYILPWFDLPKFAAALLVGLAIISVIEYRYIVPSIWAFRGRQMDLRNDHNEKIDAILKGLEEIEQRLSQMSKGAG